MCGVRRQGGVGDRSPKHLVLPLMSSSSQAKCSSSRQRNIPQFRRVPTVPPPVKSLVFVDLHQSSSKNTYCIPNVFVSNSQPFERHTPPKKPTKPRVSGGRKATGL